jgi:hypothetical protein
MITLSFANSKKLICCSASRFGDLSKLAVRYGNEAIANECGNLLMNLTTLSDLTVAKNKDANQFADNFMDNFMDFFNDFSADLTGVVGQTNQTTVLPLLQGLNANCHSFINDNITPLS